MRWTLSSKFRVAPGVACFSFTSEQLFVNAQAEGLEWIGSHFRVTVKVNREEINRYYSLCLFFNVANLLRWYASNKKQGFPSRMMAEKFSGANTTLDLIAREYAPHGKMSTYLHAMEPGSPVTITGPMGPGLLLTPDLTGHFCAFGAGTGILPFLDLVEFLWWKEIDTLESSQHRKGLSGFHLTLYASFFNEEDIIAHDLLQSTHDLCAKGMNPRFRLVLYTDGRKTEDRNALVAGVFAKVETQRVWVCGPPGFCTWVKGIALETGVSRKKIIVM
jgi:ferredoxin-NADP reductase